MNTKISIPVMSKKVGGGMTKSAGMKSKSASAGSAKTGTMSRPHKRTYV